MTTTVRNNSIIAALWQCHRAPAILLWMTVFMLMPLIFPGAVKAGPVLKVSNGTQPQPSAVGQSGATVLIYHRFAEGRYPTTNIASERFEEQLAYLKANNYQVLPLNELVARLKEQRPFPERTVAITIDDGYRSTYQVAWPILRKYGFPFTVFVYVEAVDKEKRGYISWDQMREMQAAGVDFQNHGYGHLRLTAPLEGMTDEEYRAWIRADLAVSTRILAQEIGQRPEFLAVPYGEYNKAVIDEARSFGYQGIFMQDPGSINNDTNRFSIPREPILGRDWAGMTHFKRILQRQDLPLADMEPLTVGHDEVVPIFGARVLHPERYEATSFRIYVSELGWQPATLRGDIVTIANDRKLQRRINRVAISAQEKGGNITAIRFWLLVAGDGHAAHGQDETKR